MNGDYESRTLAGVYGYKDHWGALGADVAGELLAVVQPHRTFDERPTTA